MSSHTEWGKANEALHTLHDANAAEFYYEPEEPIHAAFVLGLFNANGDGLALEGTRRQLLDYLRLVTEHVQRETDPRLELDQALKRLHTLRQERAAMLENGHYDAAARLDDQEIDLLKDVAEAAAEVNDQL